MSRNDRKNVACSNVFNASRSPHPTPHLLRLLYSMPGFQVVLRYAVFGLVVLAAIVALGSWLVRSRKVSNFGVLGRTLRSVTDPIVRPVERRLVRMGGNPIHAGGWLVVITAVGGIVFLAVVGWLVTTYQTTQAAASR